ncbi:MULTISPECIES: hypothetical protein [Pseudomonas]|uniref:Fibronectin type-III domain-containing protein n=1 Tax=Pseudomonas putida TaxID=303 RepID=A0A1B2FC63_PSEPU|nr:MULTISPECIES: hypothetical protein [Pseudomonas]ANY89819.1 hypothetical protein IEC33019_4312 [Pseudomonas putida]MCL8303928.1 hypothetical protein [Pseudomonas putida]
MLERYSICLTLAFACLAPFASASSVSGVQGWPVARLLSPAPVPDPDMTIERLDNGDMKVTWRIAPPDLQCYRIKYGPPKTLDCNAPADYEMLRHASHEFRRQDLPLKLCTKAEDIAKHHSAPREDLLRLQTP